MDNIREIIFFISAAGCFNGIILSAYFLFFNKTKILSNYLFGFLLLILSVRISKSVIWYFEPDIPIIFVQFGLAICFFIGPLLFIYLKSSLTQSKIMSLSWKIILWICFAIVFILMLFFTDASQLDLWKKYFVKIIYFQWLFFIVASGFLIKPILRNFFKKSLKPNEKWLLAVYCANLMIVLNYVVSFFNVFNLSYITGAISFSIIFYVNVLILLHRKKTDDLFNNGVQKYSNKKIEDTQALVLIDKLHQVLKEHKLHQNPNLKLVDLALYLNISSHQLSQLLNDNLGKTFSNFLNEYRISKACEIIASENNLKLEAVGYEVGYNSKSNFFASFKKITGTTPSIFKENLLNK